MGLGESGRHCCADPTGPGGAGRAPMSHRGAAPCAHRGQRQRGRKRSVQRPAWRRASEARGAARAGPGPGRGAARGPAARPARPTDCFKPRPQICRAAPPLPAGRPGEAPPLGARVSGRVRAQFVSGVSGSTVFVAASNCRVVVLQRPPAAAGWHTYRRAPASDAVHRRGAEPLARPWPRPRMRLRARGLGQSLTGAKPSVRPRRRP